MPNAPKKNPVRASDTRAFSPAERMERFTELQKRAFALLAASPQGYRRFLARNLRKRSIQRSF